MAPTRAPLSILSMAQKNQSHELMKQGEKLRQKPAGKPLRNRLETAWKPLGNRLETAWKPLGPTAGKPSGNRVETAVQLGASSDPQIESGPINVATHFLFFVSISIPSQLQRLIRSL